MSVVSIGLIVFAALWVLLGFLTGMRRGTVKAIVCLVHTIISVGLALLVSKLVTPAALNALEPTLRQMETLPKEVFDDPQLREPILALIQMILACPVYLILYFPLRYLYKIVAAILNRICLPKKVRAKRKFSWAGASLGVVASLIAMVAFFAPVGALAVTADEVCTGIVSGTEDPASMQSLAQVQTDVVTPLANHPVLKISRVLGKKIIYQPLTTVKANEIKTDLDTETIALNGMVRALVPLASKSPEAWEQAQIDAIDEAAHSFGKSKLLPSTASHLCHMANQKWEQGETFFGLAKPQTNEMIQPTLDLILHNFGTTTTDGFMHSLYTLSDALEVLYQHGALTALTSPEEGGEEVDMIAILAKEGLLEDLILCLYEDENLRVCIPEIVNICLRAMGEGLGMREDAESIYNAFMEDVAQILNEMSGASAADKLYAVSDALYSLSEKYGLQMTPVGATYLSACLIEDLGGSNPVTASQVADWFAVYAKSAAKDQNIQQLSSDKNGTLELLASASVSCSADFTGAFPVGRASYSFKDGEMSTVVTLTTYSDGSVYAQKVTTEKTGSVTKTSTYATMYSGVDQDRFQADFPGLHLEIGNRADNRGLILVLTASGLNEFKITVKPRRITAAEAAEVNANSTITTAELNTLNQLQILFQNYGDVSFTIPNSVRESILAANRAVGVEVAVPTSVTSASEFVNLLKTATLQSGLSTGTAQTFQNAQIMRTNQVYLQQLILDSATISAELPSLNKEEIARTLAASLGGMLKVINESDDAKIDVTLEALNDLQKAVNALDPDSDAPAIAGSILQGEKVQEILKVDSSVLNGVTDVLNTDSENATNVVKDLAQTISSLGNMTDTEPEKVQEELNKLLTDITPEGAKAISSSMNAALLEAASVPKESAEGTAQVISTMFGKLADIKEQEKDAEEGDKTSFEKEAEGMNVLLDIAINKQDAIRENPDNLFGQDAALGMEADELLDTVLKSQVITDTIMETVTENPKSQYFSTKEDAHALLGLPDLSEGEKQVFAEALDNYWKENSDQYADANSANDLATAGSGTATKTDLARQLAAIGALFQVDYQPEEVHLKESATLQTITYGTTAGAGTVVVAIKQDGSVEAVAKNGGVAGMYVASGTADETIENPPLEDWLIYNPAMPVAATVNPALFSQVPGLQVTTQNMLK